MEIEILEGFPAIEIVIKCPEISDDVQKMVSLLHSCGQKLHGIKDGITRLIREQDILYFESVDKRCYLYTESDVYEIPLKLYEIEERLTDSGFFRNSKSQILNIAKIASLCPDFGGRMDVVLENGEKLIVSRQYSKLLKERLGL